MGRYREREREKKKKETRGSSGLPKSRREQKKKRKCPTLMAILFCSNSPVFCYFSCSLEAAETHVFPSFFAFGRYENPFLAGGQRQNKNVLLCPEGEARKHFSLGARKSVFLCRKFSESPSVMDVGIKNPGRLHQKCCFPASLVMGRSETCQPHSGIKVWTLRRKSWPKKCLLIKF